MPPPSLAPRFGASPGQAAVEFVALLPAILLLLAFAWQAVLAGEAMWQARVAARAAARAAAVGSDATAAARAHLPGRLEPGLRVSEPDEGDVRVTLRIPRALAAIGLGSVGATGHFEPQSG